jgi:hypothetical protein
MNEGQVERSEILPLLGVVVKSGEWIMGYCPVHADGTKHHGKGGHSLGLSNAGVLKCFAGCQFKDVMAALRERDPRPTPIQRPTGPSSPSQPVKVYKYVNEDGGVLAEKGRFETADGRKTFRWRLPGQDGWPADAGVKVADMPLFGLRLLKERPDEPVYLVEGEKACEACWQHGLLAVSHAGGASTKDFGRSLEPLKDRLVMLWPDNDAPGRAYMAVVQARLASVASSVHIVNVPVPEKGDAFDYFAQGGTVEHLEDASPTEPALHVLGEESLRVVYPTMAGPVTITFLEMEKGRRELDTELAIALHGQRQPFTERINLLSASARTELRRSLEATYGKEFNWPLLLNTAFAMAREAFLQQDRGKDIYEVPDPVGEVLLVPPLVVADGVTVVFGDGSSLKSYFLLALALHIGAGQEFCGLPVPIFPVLYVDYEDSAPNVRRRIKRIARGMMPDLYDTPPSNAIFYWDARGIPFKDQVDAIKKKVEKEGIGLLVIDSAAPATGGPPEESEPTLALFRALKKVGIPAIIIAHITKGSDTLKPFGSSFWHNEARRTWYVERIQEEDSDDLDIGLYCRKVNDGRLPAPLRFHVSFSGINGPVVLDLGDIAEVPELRDRMRPQGRVLAALANGPLTIREVAEETGLTQAATEKLLRRHLFTKAGTKPGARGRPETLWARRATSDLFAESV